MDLANHGFIRSFTRLCKDAFKMGWHESNGGNLSYRLKPEDIRDVKDIFKPRQERFGTRRDVPGLGDEYFLVTGAGRHFRDIPANPAANIGIIKLDEDGEDYTVVYGYEGFEPTSGLITHLIGHDVKKHSQNHRVIYHCHPPNTIALTFITALNGKAFTRMLWQSLTEAAIVLPKGVEVIGWMPPGQPEIAEATGEAFKCVDAVVWAHHGLCVSGADYDTAFALAHTIEKAAEIAVKVISMGGAKHRITRKNLADLSKAFELNIHL